MAERESPKHFILVHGACHGAWCWYKVATSLRAAGHRVTVPDLGDSGGEGRIETVSDHLQPLMETMASLGPHEKVTLVGHSFGGFFIAMVMERFPQKISAAVFVTAFMPKPASPPLLMLDKVSAGFPVESWLDCQVRFQGPGPTPDQLLLGPKYLATFMYQCSPPEDLTLATMLMRWYTFFKDELARESMVSEENYGSINRVYIITKEDAIMKKDIQNSMIENYPVKEVKEIEGADHMAMISKPQELCFCLLEIANKYS